jgi:NADPH-dependent 2,4-dienoyl-CoA reductase/sulfur reductase-like enzyme
MRKADIVIVGGSAAGIEAAITAQKHYEQKKIMVIRKEQQALVPCGIPYIMGTLGSAEKNVMPTALLGNAELVIDEVISIDREAQTVTTRGGETMGYERLILATGSRPVVPPIPGADLENVFTIRKDIAYLGQLQTALKNAQDVAIVGGGFIGAEFADECRKMGLNVIIVELLEHCLYLNCDEDFCIRLEDTMRESGVQVNTECRVRSIEGKGKAEYVECEKGLRFKSDVVILAIGVTPNSELARDAGLKIGEKNAISVDQYMITSDPHIFAVGDCAEKFCYFTGKPTATWLASVATREARIAGANLFQSRRRRNQGTVGVFGTVIGDTAIGVAGLTERAAKGYGFDLITGEAAAVDKHPGSMPGAKELRVKLIFDRSSRKLLGGEACGGLTAGELANIMAQAITAGMTADDIACSQVGTHPALTASPVVYQIVNAAEEAVKQLS